MLLSSCQNKTAKLARFSFSARQAEFESAEKGVNMVRFCPFIPGSDDAAPLVLRWSDHAFEIHYAEEHPVHFGFPLALFPFKLND
jgi:hypothetical protein